MRLTQVLLRKRKMNRKPDSYVRSWMWNNHWYLNQERPVRNFKIKETLEERGLQIYKIDDLLSPISPPIVDDLQNYKFDTQLLEQKRDATHPLWKEEPVFSYSERSWQPRDEQLTFALALTNTTSADSLPQKIIDKYNAVKTSPAGEERLGNMLKSCFIGDAYQRLLPRNFKVPYIGWHPVESTMNPRNQYDYTKFSWGRNTPREYGVPNNRKLANLTRGLFKEVCRNRGVGMTEQSFVEGSKIRQFFRAKDGKLVRFYFDLPFTVLGRNPLENMKYETQRDVPDVTPLKPVTALFKENIYEEINNHPVLNKQHSHPYVHTVFRHYVSHIAPKYCEDHEQARCLIYAYAAALGQARLLYGSDISGDLPTPITINSISTNGPKFILSCFQLNSLDLASSQTNNFAFTATPLDLFEFCDLDQARIRFTGLNMDTYRWLEAMLTQD